MNRKLPRLLQPNARLHFLLLIAFAIVTFFIGDYYRILAFAMLVVVIILALYTQIATRKRTKKLLEYLESISDSMDLTVRDTPLPAVIYMPETGGVVWSNNRFIALTNTREHFFELNISDVVPDFTWEWLLDGKTECPKPISIKDRIFRVYGNMVRSGREYYAMTFWIDITEYVKTSEEYLDSRLVFTILALDNYDELLKGMSEKDKSILLSNIDEVVSVWAGDRGGYLCKFDRDRYFYLFEERHLDGFVKDNFSILDDVRANIGADGVHATLCIGIGKDGKTPQESYRYASLGLEMALSRGGDQAVIMNMYGFEFFGGHSPQPETRTKVKSRIMASAFGELLSDASKVFIIGHKIADFDSVGAAIGLCCIARARRKTARIIVDFDNNAAQVLIDMMMQTPEYRDVFITEQQAILEADSKTLLVVVDTSRPDKVESESLLLSCTRIAVVDHHRRAADYIDNAVLNFTEPYASSSSELVTELMQYLVERDDVLVPEVAALLAGIVLDTKGFAINTGSGTFDAAAYLRRMGADASAVKRLMQSDMLTATERYSLIHEAVIYKDGIAIASGGHVNSKISIAQAADELLNVSGVHASFVTALEGETVIVSGRSIGNVNVQVILEKLGGGGSQSTAGLQLNDTSVEQVVADLKVVIDAYIAEDERRR